MQNRDFTKKFEIDLTIERSIALNNGLHVDAEFLQLVFESKIDAAKIRIVPFDKSIGKVETPITSGDFYNSTTGRPIDGAYIYNDAQDDEDAVIYANLGVVLQKNLIKGNVAISDCPSTFGDVSNVIVAEDGPFKLCDASLVPRTIKIQNGTYKIWYGNKNINYDSETDFVSGFDIETDETIDIKTKDELWIYSYAGGIFKWNEVK